LRQLLQSKQQSWGLVSSTPLLLLLLHLVVLAEHQQAGQSLSSHSLLLLLYLASPGEHQLAYGEQTQLRPCPHP
jgi:hypothetical protein